MTKDAPEEFVPFIPIHCSFFGLLLRFFLFLSVSILQKQENAFDHLFVYFILSPPSSFFLSLHLIIIVSYIITSMNVYSILVSRSWRRKMSAWNINSENEGRTQVMLLMQTLGSRLWCRRIKTNTEPCKVITRFSRTSIQSTHLFFKVFIMILNLFVLGTTFFVVNCQYNSTDRWHIQQQKEPHVECQSNFISHQMTSSDDMRCNKVILKNKTMTKNPINRNDYFLEITLTQDQKVINKSMWR